MSSVLLQSPLAVAGHGFYGGRSLDSSGFPNYLRAPATSFYYQRLTMTETAVL